MKLRGETLKSIARQKGMTAEQLAAAVEKPALQGERAVKAVRNWFQGRDHPHCKAPDIARLAQALGCQVRDLARFESRIRWHRGSPRKARLLVDLVRGKSVEDARNLLSFTTKRAAVNVKKALDAAIADALQYEVDETKLVVCACAVDDGPRMKRFNQKDRGRAHQILKRFSHITVSVEEKTPGRKRR